MQDADCTVYSTVSAHDVRIANGARRLTPASGVANPVDGTSSPWAADRRAASSQDKRALVVTSSCRTGSTTERLGALLAAVLRDLPITAEVVHVGELGLPPCTGAAGQQNLACVRAWRERVASADCYVWASTEWHGSIAGSFKNALDFLTDDDMRWKILALAAQAGGALGAVSSLAHMRTIAQHLGAWVLPTQLSVHPRDLAAQPNGPILQRMRRMARELEGAMSQDSRSI